MNKVLFELPIYSCSQHSFCNYWKKKENKLIEDAKKMGRTEETIQNLLLLNTPRNIWKYNHIIGYIVVWVNSHDVNFDLYRTLDTRFFKNTSKKHFIQNMGITGYHFYAEEKDDQEIKKEILSWIHAIKKEQLKGRFFIDCTVMNNLLPYIDIHRIMNDLKDDKNGQKRN